MRGRWWASARRTNSCTPYGVSFDKPMARTLPAFTKRCIASNCSKIGAQSASLLGSKYICPNAGTLRAGQWIWYRSMTSVCRRRKLASHAASISAAVRPLFSPRTHGMPRDGPATLDAKTTCARLPGFFANQCPMMVSVAPQVSALVGTEYTSAVSQKWTPRASARSMMACEVASSTCSPKVMVPKQMGPTFKSD